LKLIVNSETDLLIHLPYIEFQYKE